MIILKKYNNEKGVSLVELMISVAIFSMVAITASGVFINAMKAQKSMIVKQNVTDNLRYALEFMVKELRMAQENATPTLTFNNGAGVQIKNDAFPGISFVNGSGKTIIYALNGGIITRNNTTDATGAQSVSSNEAEITGLSFILNDWNLSAGGQAPLVTILIKAKSRSGVGGEMEIQTSVSPRIY